jgi:tRNA-(ms[2]io[6]A)-hydroxylase
MLKLLNQTNPAWTQCVLSDFDAFLTDHAMCEQKASGLALHLVNHYRDKPELVEAMIALALEELEHFQQVMALITQRGGQLGKATKDPYVKQLRALMRTGTRPWFLDRLLVFGIVEARGCERFGLIADALEPGPLKDFYQDITRSEARHHGLFTRLARQYFDEAEVRQRLDELLVAEAEIVDGLELRPALH